MKVFLTFSGDNQIEHWAKMGFNYTLFYKLRQAAVDKKSRKSYATPLRLNFFCLKIIRFLLCRFTTNFVNLIFPKLKPCSEHSRWIFF